MSVHSYLGLAALAATLAVPLSARAEADPSGELTLASKDVAAPRRSTSPWAFA